MNYLLKTTFSNNYNLIHANDISAGISRLKSTTIDLLIIDTDSETQESIDFMKFVSKSTLYSKPVIVLSSDKKIKEKVGEEVFSHYFLKPFDPIELSIAADKILQPSLTSAP